jgi:hypothetical protein
LLVYISLVVVVLCVCTVQVGVVAVHGWLQG